MDETNSSGHSLDGAIFDWENGMTEKSRTHNSKHPGINDSVFSEDNTTKKAKLDTQLHQEDQNIQSLTNKMINTDNLIGSDYSRQTKKKNSTQLMKIQMPDLSSLIAELLEESLNEYNLENLRSIFENYFHHYCSILFKTKDRMYGSGLIFEHYQSLLNAFTNCCFRFYAKQKHHCLMVLEESCVGNCPLTGSLQSINDIDYLWKCFDILNFASESDSLIFQKKFYDKLFMNNTSVRFNLKVDLYLIMNADMTRIIHATWEVVSLDFIDEYDGDFSLKDWC